MTTLGPTLLAPAAAMPVSTLVLSEVLYDSSGSDNGFEWVELFNGGDAVIDLSAWSLGYGGGDYTHGTLQLAGSVGVGEYFVVGGPESTAGNGSPVFDLALDFSPDLQNSGTTADGVALFRLLASEITANSVPFGAVIYGQTNTNGLLDETGLPGPVDVGDASGGESIALTQAGIWTLQNAPDPGIGGLVGQAPSSVEEPTALLLAAFGIVLLSAGHALARRRDRNSTSPRRMWPLAGVRSAPSGKDQRRVRP